MPHTNALALAAALAWSAFAATPALAQDAAEPYQNDAYLWNVSEEEEDDPFAEYLFEPGLVLEHADAIGLTAEQRTELIDEVVSIQADISRAELMAVSSMSELHTLMEAEVIDVDAVMPLVESLLEIETETKRRYLTLMIELRNALSPGQRDRLRQLRSWGESHYDN